MTRRLLLFASVLLVAGCGHAPAQRPAARTAAPAVTATVAPVPAESVPAKPFAVGVRHLQLKRGDRQLPTTVWYPAAGSPPAGNGAGGGASLPSRADAAPAAGRFPLVVFSHGLGSLPEAYGPLTTRWAAAGFVVAAPAYPGTSAHAKQLNVLDIANQPEDASTVIDGVLASDALAAHVDPQRIGAAGHSAGGYTTVGMFTGKRDPRLRAGVVLAGGPLGGDFQGTPAPLLFVHGDKDPTVSYATGRGAYDAAPWPKAFMTLIGANHLGYLGPSDRPFGAALTTTTDFLRWALYGDPAAKSRLHGDATVTGVSRLDSTL